MVHYVRMARCTVFYLCLSHAGGPHRNRLCPVGGPSDTDFELSRVENGREWLTHPGNARAPVLSACIAEEERQWGLQRPTCSLSSQTSTTSRAELQRSRGSRRSTAT